MFEGFGRLGGLAGLTAREIGRFQPPCVVFVLGLALLVGRLGMRGTGGLRVAFQFGGELGDNLLDEGGFLHEPPMERDAQTPRNGKRC